MTHQSQARVDDALYRRVCEFYYDEADLLAQRQLTQWFELLTEDVHYRVGFPEFYEHGTRRQVGIGNPYFDDDHTSMKVRVRLLGNQTLTTAEHPPSVYNYFVSNIRARCGQGRRTRRRQPVADLPRARQRTHALHPGRPPPRPAAHHRWQLSHRPPRGEHRSGHHPGTEPELFRLIDAENSLHGIFQLAAARCTPALSAE